MEDSGHRLISAAGGCLEPFMALPTLLIVLAIGGLFALWKGVSDGEPVAFVALGGVATLALVLIGVALAIGIIAFASWSETRRELRAQARFQQNTAENLAQMEAMAKVQIQQARAQATHNSMLLKQAREAQRQLPAPAEDVPSIIYDEGIFDELEMGSDHPEGEVT
jgi:hypothetical protein